MRRQRVRRVQRWPSEPRGGPDLERPVAFSARRPNKQEDDPVPSCLKSGSTVPAGVMGGRRGSRCGSITYERYNITVASMVGFPVG